MRTLLQKSFKFSLLLLGFGVFSFHNSYAQLDNVGTILQSGKADANILAKEYLSPLGKGFGAGLNSGWFTTAKTHHTLGFDITASTSLAFIPSSDQSFNAANLKLQRLQYDQNSPQMSSTIGGPKQMGSKFNIVDQGYNLGSITMPEGTGYHFIPSPMIQVGVGLIHHTDIMIRFLPNIKVPNYGRFHLYGFGIKHGLNQWIPGGKFLPVNLSIMAGFTDFKANSGLNVQPQDGPNTTDSYDPSTWNGQKITTETKAYTINALVGKSLPILAVYAGVGYESSKMTVATPGNYPVTVPAPTQANPSHKKIDKLVRPIAFSIKGANSFRALVGLRIHVLIFSLSANYTIANYSMANVGFGFSFR
ncbi:MAG TPA: DUF6588 family protein [Balneolales bacterium]|nr:DUF6588 family protein [Balneolales bacterium]